MPPEEPSKLQPRKPHKDRKDIVTSNTFSLPWSKALAFFVPLTNPFWRRVYLCPYLNIPVTNDCWAYDCVTKRLKAYLVRDRKLNIWWLQSTVTKQPISPEFSSKDSLTNWVIYEGLTRGYIKVESFTGYKGRVINHFVNI